MLRFFCDPRLQELNLLSIDESVYRNNDTTLVDIIDELAKKEKGSIIDSIGRWCNHLGDEIAPSKCSNLELCEKYREYVKKKGFAKGVLMGKYDIVTISHQFFHMTGTITKYYLKEPSSIKDALTIPITRIVKIKRDDNTIHPLPDLNSFDMPFLVLTFIKPLIKPINKPSNGCTDDCEDNCIFSPNMKNASAILESLLNIVQKNEISHYSVYLTHSNYRLLIVWQFASQTQMIQTLEEMRRSLTTIVETVSYIGLSSDFCRNDTATIEQPYSDNELYTVLVKVRPGTRPEELRSILRDLISVDCRKVKLTMECSYWDYAFILDMYKDVRALVVDKINILRRDASIYKALTIQRHIIDKHKASATSNREE